MRLTSRHVRVKGEKRNSHYRKKARKLGMFAFNLIFVVFCCVLCTEFQNHIDLMPMLQLLVRNALPPAHRKELQSMSFSRSYHIHAKSPSSDSQEFLSQLKEELSDISSLCVSGITVGVKAEKEEPTFYLPHGGTAGKRNCQPANPAQKTRLSQVMRDVNRLGKHRSSMVHKLHGSQKVETEDRVTVNGTGERQETVAKGTSNLPATPKHDSEWSHKTLEFSISIFYIKLLIYF